MCNLVVIVRIRRIWNTKSESSGFIQIQRILILAGSVVSLVRRHYISIDYLPPDCWRRLQQSGISSACIHMTLHFRLLWLISPELSWWDRHSEGRPCICVTAGFLLDRQQVGLWTVCTMHCVVCCSLLRTFTLVLVLTNVWLRRVSKNRMLFFLLHTNFIHGKWIL